MDIKFICPHCPQTLVVDAAAAGEMLNCPNCKTQIKIPTQEGLSSASSAAPPARILNLRSCRTCGGEISVNAYSCPHCGEPKKAPVSAIPDLFHFLAVLYLVIGVLILLAFSHFVIGIP